LNSAGIEPQYEFPGEGPSTIDFGFTGNGQRATGNGQRWRVESCEHWVYLREEDGSLTYHTENDGWSFLNRGSETHDEVGLT
jgi:hypothetical protein